MFSQAGAGHKRNFNCLANNEAELERRVKQRGVSMDFLDKLKAKCISFQCLNETSAIEISEECDIPTGCSDLSQDLTVYVSFSSGN